MKILLVLERFAFAVLIVITAPLWLLWIWLFGVATVLFLPIAGVVFILTGGSILDWWMDVVGDFVLVKYPIWLWMDSINKRARQ